MTFRAPLAHLAFDHGWRQMWLFGMNAAEAERIHASQYPECMAERAIGDGQPDDSPSTDTQAIGP